MLGNYAKTLLLSTLLLILILFGCTNKVNAQNTAVIVEAPLQVDPDTDFNVSIIAENIPDQNGGMAGWQLVLTWNASLISCTGELINMAYWPQNSGPLFANPIDNTIGRYRQSLALRAPSTPVTGTYWLVNLTFHSKSDVTEPLPIVLKVLPDIESGMTYCLVDKFANEIPHEFGTSTLTIVSEFSSALLVACLLIVAAISINVLRMKKRKNL
ncbi:MAG: hypothetical protein QW660_03240 [Candidatus Bathyarchaeia archaeon]